jgi:hypothetical protein
MAAGSALKRNMVTRQVGSMLLLRQNREAPSDAEWDECLGLLKRFSADFSKAKVLVITDAGAPTPEQRKRLAAILQGQRVRVAVVSEALKFRFIVSSIALFIPDIASFRMYELSGAYDHLKLGPHERRTADLMIGEMGAMLGTPQRKSIPA